MSDSSVRPGVGILVRTYGEGGAVVVVLHGGPGAAGYMAPVCRELSPWFRVVEPLQRMSEEEPLTVARHVHDVREVIASYGGMWRPALLGHSWGAMLALAYAAEYPETICSLVLVGCGTYDPCARAAFESAVQRRLSPLIRMRLRYATRRIADPDARFCVVGRLLEPVYSYDLLPHGDETEYYDARGFEESWQDMVHLQRAGVYPAAFSRITVPVLMVHGAHDPYAGRQIFECLRTVMPQMEYVEFSHCGHYPWLERHAREAFFGLVRDWLEGQMT